MIRRPFAALKAPLLLLTTTLLLSIGGILWGHKRASGAEAALQQQQVALEEARAKLDRGRQEQQLIAAHFQDYRALVARGFVGAENRLAWIEAAQLVNRDAGLYGLDYRLQPRAAALPALAQGLPLGQTRMTLALPLLVETDLPRYLAALKARAPGVVRVDRCQLAFSESAPFEATNQPRLQAECELLWFAVALTSSRARS